jgi:spermidine/putrescine transport system permease protein
MKSITKTPKLLTATAVLVYLFLWFPVLVLLVFSFSSDKWGVSWEGFTLRWYIKLFSNVEVKTALKTSLIVASVTVVVSIIIGTLAAYGFYKLRFRAKEAIRTSSLLPIVVPYVVTGGSLLVFFRVIHFPFGFLTIILTHITFSTPLAIFVIIGRMQRIDWSLEEAAMVLGATRLNTFFRVTGPLLLPAIISAAMLVFPWSFDDFVITYFVTGVGTTTLPIYVFSQLRYGSTPVINTIGVIFIVLVIIPVLLYSIIQKKEENIK